MYKYEEAYGMQIKKLTPVKSVGPKSISKCQVELRIDRPVMEGV